jgi:hypothetical protein
MSHKSVPILFVLLAIFLALGACAPIPAQVMAPSPAPAASALAAPALASPEVAPSGTAPEATPVVATAKPSAGPSITAPAPAAPEEPVTQIPATCYREGLLTYVERGTRICFAYPQGFALASAQGLYAAGSQVQAELRGPALDPSPDPLRASLAVVMEDAAPGVTLEEAVDSYPASLGGPLEHLRRWPLTAARQPAVRLDGVPGRPTATGILLLRGGKLYRLRVAPDLSFEKAKDEMSRLIEAVTSSFGFLPASGQEAQGGTTTRAS